PSRSDSVNAGAGVCSGTKNTGESWPVETEPPRTKRHEAKRNTRRDISDPRTGILADERLQAPVAPARALALAVIENPLAHADRRRSDLHQLVVIDPLDRLLDVELPWRRELDGHIGSGSPHVRQMLLLAGLHDHVRFLHLLSDDLAAVDLLHRLDEERSAVRQSIERIRGDVSRLFGDHRPLRSVGQRTLMGPVLIEEVIPESSPLRQS